MYGIAESNRLMIFPRPSLQSARLNAALAGALIALFANTSAHAGPPFQTDDPDPVAFRHFEMYAFELSDGTGKNAGGTSLEVPAYEVNYGVVPNVQLHLVLPLTASFAPSGWPTNYGMGDSELGAKIRFVKETKRVPEVGIFPFFELPSGNADKGLGVGKAWYKLPLWMEKDWGLWTACGGAGYQLVKQTNLRSFPYTGWLIKREMGKRLELAAEIFAHGREGLGAPQTGSSAMIDAGGYYHFKNPNTQLLFAYGHSVAGQTENYAYLGMYWTWGKDRKAARNALLSGQPGKGGF